MPEQRYKSSRTVSFRDADPHEERLAAILVNKADDGSIRTYVADVPGREQPDPEIVAVLAQAVSIANL